MYCKLCNQKKKLYLCVRKKRTYQKPGLFYDHQDGHCKFLCCISCSFCNQVATKERCNSQLLLSLSRNKTCERCFLCRSVKFCKKCHKCPNCCTKSACRGQITPVLEEMGSPRHQPQPTVLREGYTLPFRPNLTRSPTVTSCYANPHLYLVEALHQLLNKNAVELVKNQESLGFYNWLFLVPKPNNQWQPILDPSNLKTEPFKMGDPRDNKNLPTSRGVGYIHRFQECILPHTYSQSVH